MMYNWQQSDWRSFRYHLDETEDMLFAFGVETGHVSGIMKGLTKNDQVEAALNLMISEAIKTSEIEGEYLSRPDVISSIRNNLGLNKKPDVINDKKAEGIGALMVAVRNTYAERLTQKTLYSWHKMLLGYDTAIVTGSWREHHEPMQVISGAMGKEKIHFEAPPSHMVGREMGRFIKWFNDTAPGGKQEIKMAPVRSAIAHIYFESIHPFEDGNGRIGRAIAEKALSQTIGRPVMLSLSHTIEANKKAYYRSLEKAQRSNEISAWIRYFVKTILDAQVHAKELIEHTLLKTRIYDRYSDQLNERQLKAVRKMLDAGPQGYKGGMSSKKYMSLTRTSKATATRDLQALADIGVLAIYGGGRSTRYRFAEI